MAGHQGQCLPKNPHLSAGKSNNPLEWSLEPPPQAVLASAARLHLLSPPPPSMSAWPLGPTLLPSQFPSTIVPASGCQLAAATTVQRQDYSSQSSQAGQRGGESNITEVSPHSEHGRHFTKLIPPPAVRRQCGFPSPAQGMVHLTQRWEKRWVSLGSGLWQSKVASFPGRKTGAPLTVRPAKPSPPKLGRFPGAPKGASERASPSHTCQLAATARPQYVLYWDWPGSPSAGEKILQRR